MPDQFDVFLCHNSQDKPEVIEIAQQLQQRGLKPWLDIWELRPGLSWQELLEEQIEQIKSAAVFVGRSGFGPWQESEMRAFLSEFVNRKCPVIPVLLKSAPQKPKLPIFLKAMTWVDFKSEYHEPMEQLIWGITGIKPPASSSAEGQQEAVTTPVPIRVPRLPRSRRQFLKWTAGLGGGLVTVVGVREIFFKDKPSTSNGESDESNKSPTSQPQTNRTTTSISEAELDSFTFETVTVDRKGEIVERDSNKQAKFFKEDLGNNVNLEMVYIPGGKFLMGTEDEEIERLVKKFNWDGFRREKPLHRVTIQPFFMGKFQVTQAQWKEIASLSKVNRDLEVDPSSFKGDARPVESVSWDDAEEFCQRLSKQTGKGYRLPSEAEWEYACRAETTTPFHFGETITTDLANYNGNSSTYADEPKGEYRGRTIPVGQFSPNAFGLYDMHGNVWEWCKDSWYDNYENAPNNGSAWLSEDSSKKVIRGGSWGYAPRFCRSAIRYDVTRDARFSGFGFRVVCVAARTT